MPFSQRFANSVARRSRREDGDCNVVRRRALGLVLEGHESSFQAVHQRPVARDKNRTRQVRSGQTPELDEPYCRSQLIQAVVETLSTTSYA